MAYDQTRTLGELGQNTTVNSSTGIIAAVTAPPQFDSSLNLATTGFVQAALGNLSTATVVGAGTSVTLTASQVGGAFVFGGGGGTITLPALSSVPLGAVFTFACTAVTAGTIATHSGDQIQFNGTGAQNVSSMSILGGDTLILMNLSSAWYCIGGSLQLKYSGTSVFAVNLVASGYQKLPTGIIIQWGSGTTSTGTGTLTFPIAFPTACRSVTCTELGAGSWSASNATFYGCASTSATGTTVRSATMTSTAGVSFGSGNYFWTAVGY